MPKGHKPRRRTKVWRFWLPAGPLKVCFHKDWTAAENSPGRAGMRLGLRPALFCACTTAPRREKDVTRESEANARLVKNAESADSSRSRYLIRQTMSGSEVPQMRAEGRCCNDIGGCEAGVARDVPLQAPLRGYPARHRLRKSSPGDDGLQRSGKTACDNCLNNGCPGSPPLSSCQKIFIYHAENVYLPKNLTIIQ